MALLYSLLGFYLFLSLASLDRYGLPLRRLRTVTAAYSLELDSKRKVERITYTNIIV